MPLLLPSRPVVAVCIGTDIVSGDCLGPLVGQMLVEADVPAFVYGTLLSPVSALNVERVNRFVRLKHAGAIVIAVDAAIGKDEGLIAVRKGALTPGAASGKSLCSVGDISITAVTARHAPAEPEFSMVRLGFVYSLAKKVSSLICSCLQSSFYYKNDAYAIANMLKAD